MLKCPLCDFISQDKYQWFNHLTFHHKADEYIDWILDMIPRSKVEAKIKLWEEKKENDEKWGEDCIMYRYVDVCESLIAALKELLNNTEKVEGE